MSQIVPGCIMCDLNVQHTLADCSKEQAYVAQGLVRNNYTVYQSDERYKSGRSSAVVWGRLAVAHECGVDVRAVPRDMRVGESVALNGYVVRRNADADRPSVGASVSARPQDPPCRCGRPGAWRGDCEGQSPQVMRCTDCCAADAVAEAVKRDGRGRAGEVLGRLAEAYMALGDCERAAKGLPAGEAQVVLDALRRARCLVGEAHDFVRVR